VNPALYGTIWLALVLFCAGEAGRRDRDAGHPAASWTWWAYAIGALLLVVHIVIAMDVAHNWSHQSSIAATARQTSAVYGLDWGGGVYANYAFVAVWLFEVWRWRRNSTPGAPHVPRARTIVWTIRIFYLVMILNAAIIFAAGWRRAAGAAIVLWLLWIWVKNDHHMEPRPQNPLHRFTALW